MRSRSVVTVLTFALSLSAFLMNISSRSSVAATACDPSVVCYFHGSAADQTNKITGTGTARFDQAPPTGTIPITQATTGVANQNVAGNALTAYWYTPFSGSIPANTLLELDWYWTTANAETIALGLDLDITVFADPQLGKVPNDKIIGRASVKATAAPTPTLSTNFVPITGTVASNMHLALVLETAHGVTVADAAGSALGTAQGVGGIATLEVGPLSAGTSTALLTNADSVEEAFELWEVFTQSR